MKIVFLFSHDKEWTKFQRLKITVIYSSTRVEQRRITYDEKTQKQNKNQKRRTKIEEQKEKNRNRRREWRKIKPKKKKKKRAYEQHHWKFWRCRGQQRWWRLQCEWLWVWRQQRQWKLNGYLIHIAAFRMMTMYLFVYVMFSRESLLAYNPSSFQLYATMSATTPPHGVDRI